MNAFMCLNVFVIRYAGEKLVVVLLVIHFAAEMLQSVAHHQIIDVHQLVIDADLVEHMLCDAYARSLVFYNDAGLQHLIIYDTVAAQPFIAQFQLHLVGHEHLRIAFMVDEEVHEMLSYPLLGSQRDVSSPQNVENLWFLGCSGNFYFERWQV